jgi:hypothetical protein
MPSIRVVLPAFVGLVLLVIGVQSAASVLQVDGGTAVAAVRRALLPCAIGAALILVSLAVSKRSRAGYLLGLATAVVGVAAGVTAIIVEIPYLAEGGLGAALGGGVVVVAALWIALWAGYGIATWRARASFATTWARGDRTMAIVVSGLAAFTVAAYVSLGAAETEATQTVDAARARAEALVAGTSVSVQVVDVTINSEGAAGTTATVERLTIELAVESAQAYALTAVPTLCLTDLATALDPAYKPDSYCWGGAGPALPLDGLVPDLGIPAGTRTLRVELTRGDSLCAFGPGSWNAELRISPSLDTRAVSGAGAEYLAISDQFLVIAEGSSASPAEGPTSDCIASSVSP